MRCRFIRRRRLRQQRHPNESAGRSLWSVRQQCRITKETADTSGRESAWLGSAPGRLPKRIGVVSVEPIDRFVSSASKMVFRERNPGGQCSNGTTARQSSAAKLLNGFLFFFFDNSLSASDRQHQRAASLSRQWLFDKQWLSTVKRRTRGSLALAAALSFLVSRRRPKIRLQLPRRQLLDSNCDR